MLCLSFISDCHGKQMAGIEHTTAWYYPWAMWNVKMTVIENSEIFISYMYPSSSTLATHYHGHAIRLHEQSVPQGWIRSCFGTNWWPGLYTRTHGANHRTIFNTLQATWRWICFLILVTNPLEIHNLGCPYLWGSFCRSLCKGDQGSSIFCVADWAALGWWLSCGRSPVLWPFQEI